MYLRCRISGPKDGEEGDLRLGENRHVRLLAVAVRKRLRTRPGLVGWELGADGYGYVLLGG